MLGQHLGSQGLGMQQVVPTLAKGRPAGRRELHDDVLAAFHERQELRLLTTG